MTELKIEEKTIEDIKRKIESYLTQNYRVVEWKRSGYSPWAYERCGMEAPEETYFTIEETTEDGTIHQRAKFDVFKKSGLTLHEAQLKFETIYYTTIDLINN